MARTHTRDTSPVPGSDADPAKLVKRLKTALDPPSESSDPAIHFAPGLFDHNNIASLNSTYNTNEPFKYALLDKLFQDELLVKVKDECITQLSFSEKETDIYKVNQTGDLASLNYLTPEQISLFPNLLTLRDTLYSSQFRNFLRAVTGCGPLSGRKQDMSVNSYVKGCHLLNHDDVIGTRRVSYILYMPLPHYQLWQKDWGGSLELYPVVNGEGGIPEPKSIPSKSIPPNWNQFVFFEVQPGRSFHSVEEVVVGSEEDVRERLSISGWFHAAQEGEEGYGSEQTIPESKSSRDQLQSTKAVFKHYFSTTDEEALATATSLSENHAAFLSEFLNPVYLQSRTMQTLASRFAEESSLELHHFLNNPLAEALEPRLRELDARDGLGPDRPLPIPPHTAGVTFDSPSLSNNSYFALRPPNGTPFSGVASPATGCLSPSPYYHSTSGLSTPNVPRQSNWTIRGPPHKWRYCTLAPRSNNKSVEAVTPRAAHVSSDEILRSLQDELFPSEAFRAWLAIVAGLMPLGWLAEARRFRPGLDYTLATSEESEARLDVVLGLTPEARPKDVSEDSDGKNVNEIRGWHAAEWGGWECYMAPHNEEDDPAVYSSGKSRTKSSNAIMPLKLNGAHTSNGVSSSRPVPMHVEPSRPSISRPQHSSVPGKGSESLSTDKDAEMNDASTRSGVTKDDGDEDFDDDDDDDHGDDDDDDDGEGEEEEEESTLLTVQPGFNRLLLVLRDERVMRFVKYVSAAAEGSRWDVCGEYEVGMVQEEDGDEGSASTGGGGNGGSS